MLVAKHFTWFEKTKQKPRRYKGTGLGCGTPLPEEKYSAQGWHMPVGVEMCHHQMYKIVKKILVN